MVLLIFRPGPLKPKCSFLEIAPQRKGGIRELESRTMRQYERFGMQGIDQVNPCREAFTGGGMSGNDRNRVNYERY